MQIEIDLASLTELQHLACPEDVRRELQRFGGVRALKKVRAICAVKTEPLDDEVGQLELVVDVPERQRHTD